MRKPAATSSVAVTTLIGLGVAWSVFLRPWWLVGAGVWLVCFVLLIWQRRALPKLLLFLSPWLIVPAGAFLVGVATYFTGTATLYGRSLGSWAGRNPDRVDRCLYRLDQGALEGARLLWGGPKNFAVQTLLDTLGPMPGSYDGPWPETDEMEAILDREGIPVTIAQLRMGRIELSGRSYEVPQDPGILSLGPSPNRELTAAPLGERGLIIRSVVVRDGMRFMHAWLVDLEKGEKFADYGTRGPVGRR